jgi:hypothetical protein
MLPEIIEREAYERGVNDAWKVATKVATLTGMGGLTGDELMEIFGFRDYSKVLIAYAGIDAINRYNNWNRPKRRRNGLSDAHIKMAHQSTRFSENSCDGCIKYEDPKYHGTYCCQTGTCDDNIEAYLDEII